MKTISVCIGSACHVNGSYKVIQVMNRLIKDKNLENEVELIGSFCMGKCTEGVAVKYEERIFSVSLENVEEIFEEIIGGM